MATLPSSARADYQKNKQTQQYTSQAKGLLYGDNGGKPSTPVHHGRKSVPHAGGSGSAPFAVFDDKAAMPTDVKGLEGGQVTKSYHALNPKKDGAGKVSNTEFDADVYRRALENNANNMTAQKARNWGSSNLLGTHA